MSDSKYIENDYRVVKDLCLDSPILILTATDIETEHTHSLMKPLNGYTQIIKVYEGDSTYYFGLLGNYLVANVQTTMGSLARNSSIMTVSSALLLLKSKIVIMVGIAFGVDDEKQNIGDVLLAESIIPYNTKRVGKDDSISRGIEAPSSKVLLDRFKNVITTWEHITSEEIKVKLIPTRLLSGEELVDNLEYRNKLLEDYPDSEGGEMEGAGVYAACDTKAQWIVVKGICDFADGDKGKDKKVRQKIAITSALSVCLEVFNSQTVFKDIDVLPYQSNVLVKSTASSSNINAVLFDIYDKDKEPYYLEREVDSTFNNTLKQFGVWIFGPSGCGKTNLIIRNLKNQNKSFIQISLASCIGLDIDSLFYEILYEVTSEIAGVESQKQPRNFSECNKTLIKLLKDNFEGKEQIIFIEEIPISEESKYKDFSSKLFSILLAKNLMNGLENVRFVLSSINNPQSNIEIFQQKIHQQLNFFQFKYWSEIEINRLIDLIEKEFEFTLSKELRNQLVLESKGSPRFVKKFFRSIHTLNKTDEKTLKSIILETSRELNQYGNV